VFDHAVRGHAGGALGRSQYNFLDFIEGDLDRSVGRRDAISCTTIYCEIRTDTHI
jgi:hypothetical protein